MLDDARESTQGAMKRKMEELVRLRSWTPCRDLPESRALNIMMEI